MHWVWRGERHIESGGFKLEYGALVLLVAVLVTAVFAFGVPTDVRTLYAEALCRIDGGEDCEEGAQGGGPAPDGEEEPSTGSEEEGTGASESPGAGSEEDSPEGEEDEYDPDALQAFLEADAALISASQEQADAEAALADSGYDQISDDLLNLVGDIIGYNDAKACLTEGDLMACLWTVVGFTPWGKGAKLVKAAPKILKFWRRWKKAKKTKEAAEETLSAAGKKVDEAKDKVDDAVKQCKVGNSFLPDTRVLMADGGTLPIEDVAVGDEVLAFDPLTGEEGPREVTGTIVGSGAKTLVDVSVGGGGGAAPLTATDGHPFWRPDGAEWIEAGELDQGMRLRSSSGAWSQVDGVEVREVPDQRVHNLTVADLHTYYVLAGSVPVLVHNADDLCGVTSAIHDDPYLVKAAEAAGKNQRLQKEMDDLVMQFRSGNKNPGLGNKALEGTDISYLRGRNGGRVFFRNTGDGIQIVGKADKSNESKVIKRLKELYGS
ncbi:hypothetical protein J0910_26970 [Nocardiopsis sp. CNT-189]|uniref:polymorphic toxin-type HINT domain-containing protein n=1 Tax=Nocardiopsis oceanisediminis TaxID=2816862 RepID=UPI003B340B46